MEKNIKNFSEEEKLKILLTEYKEGMESQRHLTNITYSWMINIALILCTGLFITGITRPQYDKISFWMLMVLGTIFCIVWWRLTETMVFYLRQRFRRINEIEETIGMKLMSEAYKEIKNMGWRAKLLEARVYIRIFVISYICAWIIVGILKF